MKGNLGVIESLNGLLADELAAVNQYTAHYLALENWGFDGLAALVHDRAKDERHHARKIAGRIFELGGAPLFGSIGPVTVALDTVPAQLTADLASEARAIDKQNAAIAVCIAAGDNSTAHILTHIVREEGEHAAEIEGWQQEIAMIGIPGFLSARIED